MDEINGYQLSRDWFNWSFENPEKVNPAHSAIYFFAIEHCNRLGWKDKFGFPSQMVMDALGIKKHHTYIKYFNDLVEWGFFKLVQKSSNQYSANIISLQSAKLKNGKALDKAFVKHAAKHTAKQLQSNGQSTGCIDKPINQLTINQLTIEPDFANSDWEIWGQMIVEGNDPGWDKMRGRKVSREEMDIFLSVATRCGWKMESQTSFRVTLKGFNVNGHEKIKSTERKLSV